MYPGTPESRPWRRRHDGLLALGLVLGLTAVYGGNGDVLPVADAVPNVYLALNLVDDGRFSFAPSSAPWLFVWKLRGSVREIRVTGDAQRIDGVPAGDLREAGLLTASPHYFLRESVRRDPRSGESLYVNIYGPGAALAALPVVAALRAAVGDLRSNPEWLWFGAKLAAALLSAGASALLFLTARRWIARGPALALAGVYGLGTAAWSTSSQTLWQHTPNAFFLALGSLFLVREGARAAMVAGLAFSAATVCRPTSALYVAAVAAYVVWHRPGHLAPFLAGAMPPVVALAWHNAWFFGSPWRFGQTATVGETAWSTPIAEGLAGLLVSPSRGLLVFSPVLALGLVGGVAAWRFREYRPLRPLSVAALLVLLIHAKWEIWWGGRSFGYRIIADLAGTLVLLAVPLVPWILAAGRRAALAALLVAWSVLVQALGAFAYDLNGWHDRVGYRVAMPGAREVILLSQDEVRAARQAGGIVRGVEEMTVDLPAWRHRLWSWTDGQLAYSLAHPGESRRAKRASMESWFRGWTAPPRASVHPARRRRCGRGPAPRGSRP